MEVGASTVSWLRFSPVDAVKHLAGKGIRCVEVVVEAPHFITGDDVVELRRLKRDSLLDYSMHCPWISVRLGQMDPLVSRAMQTLLMRSMRAAVSLEATHYVLHGGNMPLYLEWIVGLPRRKALRVLVETVKPLMRVAADGGVRVVCENIWVKEDCFSHPEHLFETMRLTGAGYCLDIAHAELTGQRRVLSKRLPDCVHAADTKLEARDDMHLNIGEGNLDYAWWMKQLRHMGFDGKIILECKEVVESRKRITALWQER